MFKNLNRNIHAQPKRIFLIDALGALVSYLCLTFLILPTIHTLTTEEILRVLLWLLPLVFVFFDTYILLAKKVNLKVNLKIIASLNTIYCLISIIFISRNLHLIPMPILGYFTIEILVIILLVCYQLKLAKFLDN